MHVFKSFDTIVRAISLIDSVKLISERTFNFELYSQSFWPGGEPNKDSRKNIYKKGNYNPYPITGLEFELSCRRKNRKTVIFDSWLNQV
jgi:hypothetical protein